MNPGQPFSRSPGTKCGKAFIPTVRATMELA